VFVAVAVSVAVCQSQQPHTDAGGAAGAAGEDVANGKVGVVILPTDIQNSGRIRTLISTVAELWKANKIIGQ
jgi:hypothetical protein